VAIDSMESQMADEAARSRLGRGLAALIGDDETPPMERGRAQRKAPLESLRPNPRNPRKAFSDAELAELADSIRERGIKRSAIRLGTLDNAKANADHLLSFIVEGVKAALPVASVVSFCKPNASTPASSQVLDRLAQETDCVVSAMGD